MTNAQRTWYEDGRVCGISYKTKVQRLVDSCGIRMTALYLKRRGYTAEQAVTLMFR